MDERWTIRALAVNVDRALSGAATAIGRTGTEVMAHVNDQNVIIPP